MVFNTYSFNPQLMFWLLKLFWFFLPIGIANMMPVFCKKLRFLDVPVDFGIRMGGKPLFGEHKTVRGLVMAALAGGFFFLIQQWLYQFEAIQAVSLIEYDIYPFYAGVLFGAGAIFGDLIKSFFKRRVGVKSGDPWFPYDQIDYVLGGILFFSLFYFPSIKEFFGLLILGVALHIIVNVIGFYLGLKEKII